jgi:geranylgeranyl reductase family protein
MTAHPSATADVLVIGGGPAGSAAATKLAQRGHSVILVERDVLPRADRFGALISPRSLAALRQLELGDLEPFHHVRHIRLTYAGKSTSAGWPSHPEYPAYAAVAARDVFDHRLLQAAEAEGVTVFRGHEATDPIIERGFARGADITAPDGSKFEARAAYSVVADGANSRFGRALGTSRRPTWPYALAHRATYRSPLHDASEVELIVDLRDRSGTPVTGYGWMLPTGDGNVTVGVMMMSTSPSFRVVNPAHLLERVVADHGDRWHLDAEPVGPVAGGRVPLGMSVGPSAGPTYLLIGDAVGAGNPLSGAGIEGALETGAIAAEVIDDALQSGSATALQQYTRQLADRYGSYYQVGRLTNRILGQPALSRRVNRLVAKRRHAANAVLRLAANELRPNRIGFAEIAFRAGRTLSRILPDD